MDNELKELKKVQSQLDKLRAKKYKIVGEADRKVAIIEEERLGLRAYRENLMMSLAR